MSDSNISIASMSDVFYKQLVNVVSEKRRNPFLASKFNGSTMDGINFEGMISNASSKSCSDYNGGYWDFAELKDNDGFFMHLGEDERFIVSNNNYAKDYDVDGRIFGLMMSMIIYSHASFQFHESKPALSQKYAEYYHHLRNSFYGLVDKLAYPQEDDEGNIITPKDSEGNDIIVTEKEKADILQMSSVCYSYLD